MKEFWLLTSGATVSQYVPAVRVTPETLTEFVYSLTVNGGTDMDLPVAVSVSAPSPLNSRVPPLPELTPERISQAAVFASSGVNMKLLEKTLVIVQVCPVGTMKSS
jgi:hypothetical protein